VNDAVTSCASSVPSNARGAPVRTVAIAGCKGGVGTSVIAANLAVALARTVNRVLLFDADLPKGSLSALLGVPATDHWHRLLAGELPLSALIGEGPGGIGVITAARGDVRLSRLSRIQHAAVIAHFSAVGVEADTLLVDTPSGLNDASLTYGAAARELLIVITDEPASLRAAAMLVGTLNRECLARRFHTVVNRANGAQHARDVHQSLLERIDPALDVLVEHAGSIPDDAHLGRSVRTGSPVVQLFPRSPSALAFAKLATRVARWPRPATPAGRIEFFVERLVQVADPTLVRVSA